MFLFENSKQQTQNLYVCAKQNDKWGLLELTPVVYAAGLSLDKTEATLNVGDTLTLKPSISPADAANQGIGWSSSDETVAAVKDGVVTALKAGTATITAKTEDGGFTAACSITVTEKSTTTDTSTPAPTNTTAESTVGTVSSTTAGDTTSAPLSPRTGESPVAAGVASALIAASALAVVLSRKKA